MGGRTMEYTLKNGTVLTDDDIAHIAEACERGEYPGQPCGEIVMGRPRLSHEPLEVISFKAPKSMCERIAAAADAAGVSRSAFLRDAAARRAKEVLSS